MKVEKPAELAKIEAIEKQIEDLKKSVANIMRLVEATYNKVRYQ